MLGTGADHHHPASTAAPPQLLLFVGIHGAVHALAKSDGKRAWSVQVSKDSSGQFVGSAPIVSLAPDAKRQRIVAVAGEVIVSLDAATGTSAWQAPAKSSAMSFGAGYPGLVLPPTQDARARPASSSIKNAELDAVVYVASQNRVRAIRLKDGSEVWRFSTASIIGSGGAGPTPALLLEDGRLYVAGNGRAWALNAATGSEVWKVEVSNHRDFSHLCTMRSSNDASTILPHPAADGTTDTKPDVRDLVLADSVALSMSSTISTFDLETGRRVLPEYQTVEKSVFTPVGNPPPSQAIVLPSDGVGPRTAITTANVTLSRVSLDDGKVLWRNELSGMGGGLGAEWMVPSIIVHYPVVNDLAAASTATSSAETTELPSYSEEDVCAAAAATTTSPAIEAADTIYMFHRSIIRAISLIDGSQLWESSNGSQGPKTRPDPCTNALAVRDAVLMTTQRDLFCFDAKTGIERWRRDGLRTGHASISALGAGLGNRSSPAVVTTQKFLAANRAGTRVETGGEMVFSAKGANNTAF